MIKSILMVCVGNICRSPIAELLLAHRLRELGQLITVDSAGIKAMAGHAIDAQMASLLPSEIVFSNFVAKQLTKEHLHQADLVLVADQFVLRKIAQGWPEYAAKTFLMGHWLGEIDIPDPHKKSNDVSQMAFELIDNSLHSWLPYL